VLGTAPESVELFVTAEFGAYLDTVLGLTTTPTSNPLEIKSRTVRAHTRRQYAGDITTISVPAHQRDVFVGGDSFAAVLPGSAAYLGEIIPGPPRQQREIQFQFVGSFQILLLNFASGTVTLPAGERLYLRSPYGVPRTFAEGSGI